MNITIIACVDERTSEGAKSVASVQSQGCEVLVAKYAGDQGWESAVNAIAPNATGSHILVLWPGVQLEANAAKSYADFIDRFALMDAVIYADYICDDKRIALPSTDPADFYAELGAGLNIHPSTLLLPRSMWQNFDPSLGDAQAAYYIHRAAAQSLCVHMAQATVRAHPLSRDKKQDRKLYRAWLASAPSLPLLTKACAARVREANYGAAFDAWWAAGAARFSGHFWKPMLRALVPTHLKRALKRTASHHVGHQGDRLDFNEIYHANGFRNNESRSGAGSTHFQTRVIREELPRLLKEWNVTSMLDIPCGDFHWMREVDLNGVDYIGADVVPAMVEANQRRYGNDRRRFMALDLINGTLPPVDLIFCRDCLVHLPFEDASKAIENIKRSDATWLLTTHFTREAANSDLDASGWRALNLTQGPFHLPQPHFLLNERCTEAGGLAGDKTLALWRIADLNAQRSAA